MHAAQVKPSHVERDSRLKEDINWDVAIRDAKRMIAENQTHIAQLEHTIRFCRQQKKARIPFPVATDAPNQEGNAQ